MLPSWIEGPFARCEDYLERSHSLVLLTEYALSDLDNEPGSDFTLVGDPYFHHELEDDKWYQQEVIAKLARDERLSEFSILHAHTLIGMWGAMDAWLHDLMAAWVLNVPAAYPAIASCLGDSRGRVRLPILPVLHGEREALAEAVVTAVERELGDGVNRAVGWLWFECRLAAVGISVERPDVVALDGLRHAQQIRHVYAHNAGRADAQFVALCGDVPAKLQEPVPVGHAAYEAARFAFAEALRVAQVGVSSSLASLNAES